MGLDIKSVGARESRKYMVSACQLVKSHELCIFYSLGVGGEPGDACVEYYFVF
jgi:hypothetical protein